MPKLATKAKNKGVISFSKLVALVENRYHLGYLLSEDEHLPSHNLERVVTTFAARGRKLMIQLKRDESCIGKPERGKTKQSTLNRLPERNSCLHKCTRRTGMTAATCVFNINNADGASLLICNRPDSFTVQQLVNVPELKSTGTLFAKVTLQQHDWPLFPGDSCRSYRYFKHK